MAKILWSFKQGYGLKSWVEGNFMLQKKDRSHMRAWLFWVTICLILSGSAVMADDQIRLSATTMRPGDFITISVDGALRSTVEVSFLGVSKQLQAYNSRYIGLVAASYFTKPGTYGLIVKITSENQSYIKEYPIEVIKRDFPEDRVVIAEKTRKEILTPGNVDADAKKAAAARKNAQMEPLPPLWEGRFIWPVQGKITTGFGLIRYMNDIEEGRHSGLDIAAPTGTPVLACNRGRVIFAGNLNVTGLTVIIHHGMGLYTSYSHLSKMAVHEGELVNVGGMVGQVGMTGLATGPHLHLTVRIGDICVDPYLVLEKELKWLP
jgi:murein DD-endopeptidase MepM/ murein hydrolase activator NlpD